MVGLTLALVLELLLILLLLMIGNNRTEPAQRNPGIASFDVGAQSEEVTEQDQQAAQQPSASVPQAPREDREQEQAPAAPQPESPRALSVDPSGPPFVEVSPETFASTDISNLPRRRPDSPSGASYGPAPGPSSDVDSAVVGTAPNGEPLYAARWYREPSDQELRGYLSTARPESWALIACRTAPDWRVEDCVGLSEYPQGSNMLRAVLAAAWQFQVRPPRRGRVSMVGSWVRIRIDYGREQRR